MKKYIILFLILNIFLISCKNDPIIEVKAVFKDEEDIIIKTPENVEEFALFTLQHKLIRIKGITKLKELKRLKIVGLYGYPDYSFLTRLPKIEKLFLQGPEVKNFNFLKHLKKLKVLYVASAHINKFELDFKNNTELVSLTLNNLHNINNDECFAIKMKNIPKSLRYLDMHLNSRIIFTEELLESIKTIEYVFLDSEIKKMFRDFFKDRSNFYFDLGIDEMRKIIPFEYQRRALAKRTEYELYYY